MNLFWVKNVRSENERNSEDFSIPWRSSSSVLFKELTSNPGKSSCSLRQRNFSWETHNSSSAFPCLTLLFGPNSKKQEKTFLFKNEKAFRYFTQSGKEISRAERISERDAPKSFPPNFPWKWKTEFIVKFCFSPLSFSLHPTSPRPWRKIT